MTVRHRAFRQGLRRLADARSDAGVSPVIGMILVLAISVVGISAILYWGLPAIDEMKASVEYRSVTTQFAELDATIKELVAGTTEKTAKRWQPALNRGQVTATSGTEGWLFAVETYQAGVDHDFVWHSIADGDNEFSIVSYSGVPVTSWFVEAYLVTGTTSQTKLNVTGGGADAPKQMGAESVAWGDAETRSFSVYVANAATATPHPIATGTYKFRIYSASTLIAEAWYVNTGRVDYQLQTAAGTREIIENNGALMVGTDGQYAILNSPPIPPPSQTAGTTRFFGRVISLTGDVSFAGDSRYDLLVSLSSTATLASYDCALATGADCIETLKVFVYGDLQEPWHAYLTGPTYSFEKETKSGVTYLEAPRQRMAFTLLGSTVNMVG